MNNVREHIIQSLQEEVYITQSLQEESYDEDEVSNLIKMYVSLLYRVFVSIIKDRNQNKYDRKYFIDLKKLLLSHFSNLTSINPSSLKSDIRRLRLRYELEENVLTSFLKYMAKNKEGIVAVSAALSAMTALVSILSGVNHLVRQVKSLKSSTNSNNNMLLLSEISDNFFYDFIDNTFDDIYRGTIKDKKKVELKIYKLLDRISNEYEILEKGLKTWKIPNKIR